MKIIKQGNISQKDTNKKIVKCPCCGETKSQIDYIKEGELHKGIGFGADLVTEGFGVYKREHVKFCYTCGCEWVE